MSACACLQRWECEAPPPTLAHTLATSSSTLCTRYRTLSAPSSGASTVQVCIQPPTAHRELVALHVEQSCGMSHGRLPAEQLS